MTKDLPEEFLRTHKQAIIGTVRKSGAPHLTSVLAVYDDGRFLVSITETRAKYRNLVRDPRASLLVLGDTFWQYVVVEGRATLVHLPEAHAGLRDYYEKAAGGPHPNWDEYDEAMQRERRVLLELSVERFSTYQV